MKEIPELIVSPGLTLGLDHSWNQIGSPQGIPDRRISCPPFLFLSHFSTCSEGPRIGIQSEDQFLGPQRPQLFHGGTEPIYVVRHLVFIPRTLLLPECPWEPVKEVKIIILPSVSHTPTWNLLGFKPSVYETKFVPYYTNVKIRKPNSCSILEDKNAWVE